MTTQQQVTSVTTKHWSDYVTTMFGPVCRRTVRSSSYSVLCVLATISSLQLAAAFTSPGAPMALYQLLSSYSITSNSFATILVVIDHVFKACLFIPTTDTVTTPDIADAFYSHVSSDCRSEFVSHIPSSHK